MKKINISIDETLLDRIDKYADNNYMSRSGLITVACNQYLTSYEALNYVKDISCSLRRIADNNLVDEEVQKELEHLEYFMKTFSAK